MEEATFKRLSREMDAFFSRENINFARLLEFGSSSMSDNALTIIHNFK